MDYEMNVSIALNNRAVQHLHRRDFDGAITLFREALAISRQLHQQAEVGHKSMEEQDSPTPTLVLDITVGHVDDPDPQFIEHNDVQVYCQAVALPALEGCDVGTITMCSFVFMFNLSMAHHLCALHMPPDAVRFAMAGHLYVLAQDLITYSDVDVDITLLAAIANNLGHIYACLQDSHRSQLCQERVDSIVMYLLDRKSNFSSVFEGFFANRRTATCAPSA